MQARHLPEMPTNPNPDPNPDPSPSPTPNQVRHLPEMLSLHGEAHEEQVVALVRYLVITP